MQAFQAQAQAQQNKALFASPTSQGQIINLQMPQHQIIQLKQPDGSSIGQQLIQVKQNNEHQQQSPMQQQIIQGPNGIFQVLQPVQTVDGQETLLIPNQHMQQAFITPSGQIIRGPLVTTSGNFLQNMQQTLQLPNGKQNCFNCTSIN